MSPFGDYSPLPAAVDRRGIGLSRTGAVGADLLQSDWLGATPIRMGGLHDVAREANFEAKESGESPNVGSRWGVVASRRRIRGSCWYGGRYSNGEHGNYFR